MKKLFAEFKEFAIKGNVIDLAVGVVIATSFNAIVSSLVKDIIMPLVGIIIGGRDFKMLSIHVGAASINYGMLIQAVVDFLIVAFSLFVVIKCMNEINRKFKKEPEQEEVKEEPKKSDEVILLEEIRDLLKNKE